MKNWKIVRIILVAVLATTACQIIDTFKEPTSATIIELPFEAAFSTEDVGKNISGCDGDNTTLISQRGAGISDYFGRFSTELTFCLNDSDNTYGGHGMFVTDGGDELWFEIVGQLIFVPLPQNSDSAIFNDNFVFVGGTGIYAGLTGGGNTHGNVKLSQHITEHVWLGRLAIGRRSSNPLSDSIRAIRD